MFLGKFLYPEPQLARQALRVAFGLTTGVAPDRFLVGRQDARTRHGAAAPVPDHHAQLPFAIGQY